VYVSNVEFGHDHVDFKWFCDNIAEISIRVHLRIVIHIADDCAVVEEE